MTHPFKAVRFFHSFLVRPVRPGMRTLAVALAAFVGLTGHFLENSPLLKELDVSSVVEQIHVTLERKEEIRDNFR
ncbi:MAG: hypothetical protein JSR33_08485 [Proteobacteria bacterium]|nr:hypothetical protein [Pseudomonadota bacterium]